MYDETLDFQPEPVDIDLDENKTILSTEEMLKILETSPNRCLSWL